MESIPIVAIRFHAKYGHFRKPYSNVSSLTYPFPPRPTIAGLMGAVLGIKKEDVPDVFDENGMKAGVEIENGIRTITHVTNFRQDSSGDISYSIKIQKKAKPSKPLKNIPKSNKATQIPMELLRSPSYILYIHITDEKKMEELESRITGQRFVYTPCMGLSEFLAGLELHPLQKNATRLNPGEREISTVIAKDDCALLLNKIKTGRDHNIQELSVPYIGNKERRFTYRKYLFNMMPSPLPVNMRGETYQIDNKIITFL